MQLKRDWFEAGWSVVKVISPLEAIVCQADGRLMYVYGKDQVMAARPTDRHVYCIKFLPGRMAEASTHLRRFGFTSFLMGPSPDVVQVTVDVVPEKYEVDSDTRYAPDENQVERCPGVAKCIYEGRHKHGTRWEYRDGDLYA